MKFKKIVLPILGGITGLIVIVLAVFFIKGNNLLNQKYAITPENINIPTDAASIARGKHFAQAICAGCHGPDLAGMNLLNAPFATIDSANLTPSEYGAGSEFSDADFVRAIRHGVDNKGRPVIVMPANVFWYFSDQDLGDIIAYLRTLPPVDKQQEDPHINVLGKIMIGAGVFGQKIVPASVIDHASRPATPSIGVTAAYGEYLVNVTGCRDCHGTELAGGKNTKPGSIDAPNLTPGGDLKNWSAEQFINTIRSGTAPNGHQLNPDDMPWKTISTYTDDELTAVYLYLQSLQPLETVKP